MFLCVFESEREGFVSSTYSTTVSFSLPIWIPSFLQYPLSPFLGACYCDLEKRRKGKEEEERRELRKDERTKEWDKRARCHNIWDILDPFHAGKNNLGIPEVDKLIRTSFS